MQMRIVTIALSDGVIGQTWHFLDLIMINPKDQWTPFPKNNLTFTKSLFDKEQEVFYLQYNSMVKGYHRLHKNHESRFSTGLELCNEKNLWNV